MSGYRQSGFDPNAHPRGGAPLRPFNATQWTGVVIGGIGLVLTVLGVIGQLGWIRPLFAGSTPVFVLPLIGVVLVNSRREPGPPVDEPQRARNKRTFIITAAICAALLGAATIIQFSGAV